MPIRSEVVEFVATRVADADLRDWLTRLLADLVNIDTAITPDVAALADGERRMFERIERELRATGGECVRIDRVAIDPAIADDPYFTPPYYAGDAGVACYAGRSNLVAIFDAAAAGAPTLWNAHIDTVAPFYGAAITDGTVGGRGAADDKASVAMLIAQAKLLAELRAAGLHAPTPRAYQFVIDEESGGNGTLSAVRDARFADWPTFLCDTTGNVPHPAGRGCVWFRVDMDCRLDPRVNPAELAACVVLGIEGAGRQLRAESVHPLFRPGHAQTSCCVLGPFGSHPSSVNHRVVLRLWPRAKLSPTRIEALCETIELALDEYCERYGDRTDETDAAGRPRLAEHFSLDAAAEPLALTVFGLGGHMGEVADLDNAITKTAFIVAAIMELNEQSREPVWKVGLAEGNGVGSRLPERPEGCFAQTTPDPVSAPPWRVTLEGGQGFLPTHTLADVQRRIADAAERAAVEYVKSLRVRLPKDSPITRTTFAKLHNAAYETPPDSAAMQAMRAAFDAAGLDWPAVSGWPVSSDARIYARDGRPVVAFGPGRLAQAHSPAEFVEIDELLEAVLIATLAATAMG